jgi:ribosomal protein L11 methyltransferase
LADSPPVDGTSAEGTWLELSVVADSEAVEVVSEILTRFAPGGASVEPGFDLVDEGLGARLNPGRPVVVRAYLPARDTAYARRAIDAATTALGHLQAFGLRPIGELQTRLVRESDWADAWKAFFPVLRVGRRIVIRPTWRRHHRAPEDVVLALDPGMAFGTGLHPTTRLCLAGLESGADDGLLEGARVLDVGSGSGILSIAAARLGASAVLGIDTDPIAVAASEANARRNRVVRRVRTRRGSVPTGEGAFDLVLANLIASLLVRLAPDLAGELRPGGWILASGIFVDREAEVRDAFAAAGLVVARTTREGEWVALVARRRGQAPGVRPTRGSGGRKDRPTIAPHHPPEPALTP